ncbi:MAG: PAS domain S-box protein, partial [Burkholderiaceae bacterium]
TPPADIGRRVDLDRLGRPAGSPLREWLGPLQQVRELGELADPAPPRRVAAALPMLRGVEAGGATHWLVALINVDFLSTQHALITSGQPVRALTLGLDGTLIDSTGEAGAVPGGDLRGLAPFTRFLPEQESGSYIDAGSEGKPVVGAFRTSRLWPLVVIAEQPLAEVQADWRGRAAAAWGIALAVVGLLVGLGAVAELGLRREVRSRLELATLHADVARAEERWKLALEGAGHGVWDLDLASGRASLLAPLMALLGQPAQPVEWTLADWRAQVHPDDIEPALEAARHHLQGKVPKAEFELRMRNAQGGWQWVLARGTRSGEPDASGRGSRLIGTLTDIDARKTVEAALRESQARQQAILHSALDGIITVDAAGRVTDFNPAAEAIFGHRRDDVLGRPMHQLIVPHRHRQAYQDGMARYEATGKGQVLNRRIKVKALRANGQEFPIELAVVPVATESGVVFTATVRDISEQQRTEAALRESEARAHATFEQAAVGVLQQSADRRFLRVNQTLCRMLSYEREEFLELDANVLIHPDDLDAAIAGTQRLFRGEIASHVEEKRYRHHDGHYVWVRLTASLLNDESGRPLTMIGVVEDIGQRRAAELERDQLLQQFREAAVDLERQRLALDEHAIVSISDATGRITYVNSRLCAVSGYSADELLGRQHSLLVLAGDHDTPSPLQWTAEGARALGRELLKRLQAGGIWRGELVHKRKDGSRFWAASTVVPMRDAQGRLQQVFSIQTDITARVQAEQELQMSRSREVMIGARIQQSLLVDTPDQRLPGLWLSTLSQASQGIDGDFVELVSLGARGVDIIVGDVMGKGVGAALMGAATKMQFSRCFAELLARPGMSDSLPAPAEVMAAVHRAMTPRLQELDAFVTLSYLRLDTQTGRLTWVGCGHEEPLLLGADGQVRKLHNQHPPLGVLGEVEFEQETLPLVRGDALFLSSDGAADALLPDGSRLGRERVVGLLVGLLRELHTPAAALHALRREIDATGARLTDDLTLALALLSGDTLRASRRELSRGLDDLGQVRGLVDDRARKAGLDEVGASLFALACVEAYTNAVRHTRGRPSQAPIELIVLVDDDALTVDIVTLGEPFEPPQGAAETSFDEFPEGGFGLSIMRQTADSVSHGHAMGVNTIRLLRRLPRASARPGRLAPP